MMIIVPPQIHYQIVNERYPRWLQTVVIVLIGKTVLKVNQKIKQKQKILAFLCSTNIATIVEKYLNNDRYLNLKKIH